MENRENESIFKKIAKENNLVIEEYSDKVVLD
jgi:hypothetical protein